MFPPTYGEYTEYFCVYVCVCVCVCVCYTETLKFLKKCFTYTALTSNFLLKFKQFFIITIFSELFLV